MNLSPYDQYANAKLRHEATLKCLRRLQREKAPMTQVEAQLRRVSAALAEVERAEQAAFGAKARHSKPGKRIPT